MQFIADLHIHGKYSRACSSNFSIKNIEHFSKIKGLNLIGTGDFTHPLWYKELKENLSEDDSGFLKTKTGFNFVLQTEISLIYTDDNVGRRVHHTILAPNFETVDQITELLLKFGRVDYDGRPIFKIPSVDFVDYLKEINEKIEVIPAHIWTPWFGMLGSKSGYNSLKECFKEKSNKIHAIETGLSSDPKMNWRIKELDNKSIISSSDAHSYNTNRIGREATVFNIKPNYNDLVNSLKNQEVKKTIEFWPEEGKYHYDGHRNCGIVFNPIESKKHNNICPVCKRPLTIGVMNRVEELATRDENEIPSNAKPFNHYIPLIELISLTLNQGLTTIKVKKTYNDLIENFSNEFNILESVSYEDLIKVVDEKIANVILKNRTESIKFQPGYDGEYGKAILNDENIDLIKSPIKQKSIFDF